MATRAIAEPRADTGAQALRPTQPVRLWDNSNIIESFPGITLPLTFSIARASYAGVYRGACRLLGVSQRVIDDNADIFEGLLGLVAGRVYYDVSHWHRLLALLPGFGTNQALLERMMGAARPGQSGEAAQPVAAPVRQRLAMLRILARAAIGVVLFEPRARRFEQTVAALRAEVEAADVRTLSARQLFDLYTSLSARAFAAWPVTIFNDLAVMLLHGMLRRLAGEWLGEDGQSAISALLRTDGAASTAPARALSALSAKLRSTGLDLDDIASAADPTALLRNDPRLREFGDSFAAYVARWGDVAPRGLQLEQPSYGSDTASLLGTVVALARRQTMDLTPETAADRRAAAAADLEQRLTRLPHRARWPRRFVLHWLIARVRPRLVWRERMRAARIQVFAAARRVFTAVGDDLARHGHLADASDVHYLELAELDALTSGALSASAARELVWRRRAEFEGYSAQPDPPPRFETRGTEATPLADSLRASSALDIPTAPTELVLHGIGVSPGIVEARCSVIADARHAVPPVGQIVVAQSTDPGWVPLLTTAAGLLVEHGSLLSHSAIIARELGLPAIVGLTGITRAINEGDIARIDGALGEVRVRRGSS